MSPLIKEIFDRVEGKTIPVFTGDDGESEVEYTLKLGHPPGLERRATTLKNTSAT